METQTPQDMTPDEAMANLAFATSLQEQLIPKGQQEAPVEGDNSPQNAPEQTETEEVEETPEPQEDTRIDELNAKVETLQSSIDEIKNLLTNAGTQRAE